MTYPQKCLQIVVYSTNDLFKNDIKTYIIEQIILHKPSQHSTGHLTYN